VAASCSSGKNKCNQAPIDESEIFSVQGTLVLNGAFAVSKSGVPGVPAPGESRITRSMMNMTPSNAYQMLMRGDLHTLSTSSSCVSLVLPPHHCFLWSSDDQRGAFYAWRLPAAWRPDGLPVAGARPVGGKGSRMVICVLSSDSHGMDQRNEPVSALAPEVGGKCTASWLRVS
jgi:hypothetical protein